MMKVEIRNLGQTDFRAIHGDEEITLSPGDHCILSSVVHEIVVSEPVTAAPETAVTAAVAHEILQHDETSESEASHES